MTAPAGRDPAQSWGPASICSTRTWWHQDSLLTSRRDAAAVRQPRLGPTGMPGGAEGPRQKERPGRQRRYKSPPVRRSAALPAIAGVVRSVPVWARVGEAQCGCGTGWDRVSVGGFVARGFEDGMCRGTEGRSSPLTDWLPKTGLPTPTALMLFPETLTGRSTGSCRPLPERTPGESVTRPCAEAPFDDDADPLPLPASSDDADPLRLPAPSACAPPVLVHVLPAAGLSSPTTSAVLPQTFTGTFTGTWRLLPEASPGEPAAVASALLPSAAKAADAGSATAIAPEAAARAITRFRVARLIASLPS
ncbi:hypothetical protein SAMN05428944_0114 [Streptomyces sp. 1222.5]|nr:hypothetical protein BX260_0111 [Streptomyces sp. 5112.2]SEB53820.1 hypothetical protein SAMN05428944_0114 [Streptomyces sp. 1222.5]